MVDALYQGAHSSAGTHNAIMSSQDYLSQVRLCLRPSLPAAICIVLQARLRAEHHAHPSAHRPIGAGAKDVLCNKCAARGRGLSSIQSARQGVCACLQARRDLNNIEDGFYISPAFLDKISIHVAKNFLDLPKIKVPLILGEIKKSALYPLPAGLAHALPCSAALPWLARQLYEASCLPQDM